MTTNITDINQFKTVDVAVQLFENNFIPIPLHKPLSVKPDGEKRSGKEAKETNWTNTTYKSEEDVKAAFRDSDGLGLLLTQVPYGHQENLVVLDIDRNSIANDWGLVIPKLHGIDTHYNVFGRSIRPAGAILLQTDNGMSYYKSPKGEVEILTGSKQKVLPPSTIYDAKNKTYDHFKWRYGELSFRPLEIQYVTEEVLKQTCNMLALLHVLSENYPAGGDEENSRDNACQLICRLFKVSKLDFINADYTTCFINALAGTKSDLERIDKKYHKQYANYKDCNGAIGQLKKYWHVEEDVAEYILQLLEIEVVEERKSNSVNADDVILEDQPARSWCMYRLMPAEDVMILAGDGGTGKTSLMIQICLQSHIPNSYFCKMFPFPDTPPNMFLVSQEDTTDELKLRVAIAKAALREKHPDYTGGFSNFNFESFRKDPLKLVRKTSKGIPEVNYRDVKFLQQLVGDHKLNGLILDPVSTLHIGMNENDNADMDYFVRNGVIAPLCEQMKVHVSLIAHVFKGSNTNEDDVQSSAWLARGATSLVAAARVNTALNRISKTKAKKVLGRDAPASSIFELQNNFVHFTYGKTNMSAATSGSFLRKETKKYPNKDNKTLEGMYYTEDDSYFVEMADKAEAQRIEFEKVKQSVVGCILTISNMDINKYKHHEWALVDLARDLKDREPNMKLIATDLRNNGKEEKDINFSIANHLERMFQTSWKHPEYNREFAFMNKTQKRAGVRIVRWLVMRDAEDEFEQQLKE